ncbi:MAG: FtsX-like permease family protein, partial [Gemmatimonadota bacterium]
PPPPPTVASAESELQTLAAGLARSYPEAMSGWSVNVEPLQGDMVAEARPLLVALMGAVALILLIACANVGNLLLARAVGRDREMTVRAALGAGRGRLVRQLLAEGLLLGTLGGALGLGAATVAMPLLLALAPADIPRIETVGLGSAAMAFALAATLASVLLFALLPALRITLPAGRTGLGTRDAGAGRVQARLQSAFLVGEIALSLVLLVTAGLLVRSAARLHQVELGFTSGALAAASLDLPGARYGGIEPATRFYAELTERVRAIPGVAAVTGTTEPPVVGFGMTFSFAIQGRPAGTASGREDDDNLRVVLPGYFETMGIPVLRGRGFMPQDRAGTTPVLIVNETLARKHWPDGGAVGALVSFAGPDEGPWWEIVGVVGDTRLASAAEAPIPAIYMPHAQRTWAWMSWLSLVVRTDPNVDPGGLGGAIRSVLRELDPDVPLHSLEPVEGLYEDSLAPRRFATLLLGSFAAFAMLLGAIGLYGVVSYNVAQRHRELGIRKALGAREGALVRLVLAQGLRVAVLGMALGAILALTGTRLVHSLLYGVSATDPLTYAAVSGLLLAVVLGASLVPALRAARTDPARVLRE